MKCPRCEGGDLLEEGPDWARDLFRYKCLDCGHVVTMKGALREPIAKVEDCDTVPADRPIKQQAELRHVLSHLMNAIEHVAEGFFESAFHELESVSGLVFWKDDDDMRGYLDGRTPTTETRQQQEQMHGEEQAPVSETKKPQIDHVIHDGRLRVQPRIGQILQWEGKSWEILIISSHENETLTIHGRRRDDV